MISVYQDSDFLSVYQQRKKILTVFWIITACFIVFCGSWLAYYISLPYGDKMAALPKWCVCGGTVLYLAFVFPYMGIKFKRANSYYKMLYASSIGLKNAETGFFLGYEKKDLQKDNVDVVSAVSTTWSRKRKEWMNREAYVDVEKPMPEIAQGDFAQFIVRGNFILQYEVLEKNALDKELEKDEDED
ncbi:MAG: hypothetical protein IJY38_02275 [Clostridia bacterium]|nr:hypothetical protein [Clostridia bacterium]